MKMRLFLIAAIMLLSLGLNGFAQVKYPVMSANANTENVTTVFSSTIPATEWGDHEIVDYFINCEQFQNSGTAATCIVQMVIQGIPFTFSNSMMLNNPNTGRHFIVGRLYREGDKIYVSRSSNSLVSAPSASDDFSGALGSGVIIAGIDFNVDIEIKICVDWGATNNVMYNVISGKLWKF